MSSVLDPVLAPPTSGSEIPTPVRIYTDGSILVNPGGEGGWAIVVVEEDEIVEVAAGAVPVSTNNLMEMRAMEEALKRVTPFASDPTEILCDSQYVIHGLTKWMPAWIQRDFHKVKNAEEWKALYRLYTPEWVTLTWIKGHNKDRCNELADKLAGQAARALRDA